MLDDGFSVSQAAVAGLGEDSGRLRAGQLCA
jgi:hypothetical protein